MLALQRLTEIKKDNWQEISQLQDGKILCEALRYYRDDLFSKCPELNLQVFFSITKKLNIFSISDYLNITKDQILAFYEFISHQNERILIKDLGDCKLSERFQKFKTHISDTQFCGEGENVLFSFNAQVGALNNTLVAIYSIKKNTYNGKVVNINKEVVAMAFVQKLEENVYMVNCCSILKEEGDSGHQYRKRGELLFQAIRNHFPFSAIIYGYIHPMHRRLFQLLPMLGITLEARNFPNNLLIDLMRSKSLPDEYINSSWHIFRIPETIRSANTFIDLSILYFDPDTYCEDDKYQYPKETVENITQITKDLSNYFNECKSQSPFSSSVTPYTFLDSIKKIGRVHSLVLEFDFTKEELGDLIDDLLSVGVDVIRLFPVIKTASSFFINRYQALKGLISQYKYKFYLIMSDFELRYTIQSIYSPYSKSSILSQMYKLPEKEKFPSRKYNSLDILHNEGDQLFFGAEKIAELDHYFSIDKSAKSFGKKKFFSST